MELLLFLSLFVLIVLLYFITWKHDGIGRHDCFRNNCLIVCRFESYCFHMINKYRKDFYKRKLFQKNQFHIWKLKSLVNNRILPSKVRFQNRQLLYLFVRRNSAYQTQIKNKCLLTGRSRGIIREFGISRIVFKKLVDKGDFYSIKKI